MGVGKMLCSFTCRVLSYRVSVRSWPVTCLALSYDATLLIAGMADGTAAIWDIASRQMLKTFRQHKGMARGCCACAVLAG
jgi:WD40 repeat protein